MSRRLTALGLVSTLALAACATAPTPEARAPQPVTTGAFTSAATGPFSAAEPAGGWSRLFQDPAIDALVAQALDANRDIAVAAANLAQVRAALSEARSARLPSTDISASAGRARQPDATGTYREANYASVGFDVAYELDFFGRVSRNIEAVQADADASAAALDTVRITVAAETARAYADACAANAQLAVARRTLDLQQQTFDLTRRQLDAGRGTGLDTARASAAVESTRATLPPLEAQRDGALFRLAVLTGRPPAEAPAAARACTTIPQVTSVIPVGDGASLLARRPDVRAADRRLAAATARVGVATASLYPSVRLGGSIGTQGQGLDGLGDDFSFSVGPLVSWTFPNLTAARARIAAAGAGADAALATFEQTNLTALQEVETALTRYARELDRRTALRRARDESQRARDLARMRFNEGIDNFLTVIDTERTLAGLEAQLAQSDATVTTYQIDLFRALGGGWR
jgi:NodT family efflux transporter outer membrane factor (OMF) lipoprotein